ncbi:MAG: cupin domain-containing protein [Bacteroidales bacterium]|nr:cupin domain-containing protein [Bacteroidales bacterium]
MKIQNLTNSPKVPFDIDGFILHTDKKTELIHISLKAGESLEEHKNPLDALFFIISGSALLTVNGEKWKMKANDTIKITSDQLRGWTNNTNEELRILVIKLL